MSGCVLEIVDDHIVVAYPEVLAHLMQYLALPGNISPIDLQKIESLQRLVGGEAEVGGGGVSSDDNGAGGETEENLVEAVKAIVLKSK